MFAAPWEEGAVQKAFGIVWLAYVPEPGELVLLVSGLAGLALLHRLRGKR